MIFITVGTTKFDELIKEIDRLIKEKKIKEEVIAQIGIGEYIPKYCEWFRYAPSLKSYYNKADFVITHGGAGTVFEILNLKKKAIGISNPELVVEHQKDILKKLSKEKYLIGCKNLSNLSECIKQAKQIKLKRYKKPKNKIHKKIVEFLK